jgi:tripartite-type tricarboxylate transporter receptor subunit TctC
MKLTRRTCLSQGLQAGLALSLPGLATPARAQSYPSRALQLLVSFGPGNAGDVVARMVGKKLGQNMGQAFVVDNRPAPHVAAMATITAAADGHTLFMCGSGTALSLSLLHKVPYDILKDFTHVSTMASFDFVFVTSPNAPIKTMGQLIAAAKAKPGAINVACARIGSTSSLAVEILKALTGIDVLPVPYKATGDLITAVRSEQVQVGVELLPAVLGQIRQKLLHPIAVTSRQRFSGMPEVPTVAESGVPGYEVSSWNGISVHARTPAPIVERLAREMAAAVSSPEVRDSLLAAGATPMSSTPQQMTERMKADIEKWQTIIAKANIPRQ